MARFSMMRRAIVAALAVLGCGNEDESAGSGREASAVPSAFCWSYDDLAERRGCVPLGPECEAPAEACDAHATAWILCLRDDITQCICEEGDGTLNCEGSFKPSEGAAKCVEEYERLARCLGE